MTTAPPIYLTVDDVADTAHTHSNVVYGWIKNDGLPAHRVGRRWLIAPADLDAWIRNGQKPLPEPESPTAAAGSDDWLAAQLSKFTADDFRRAGELLLALSNATRSTAA